MNRKMKLLAGAAVFLFMLLNIAGGSAAFAAEKIAVDFGSHGLYVYDGQTLTGLISWNPENMICWDDKLVADFGANGLYVYNDSLWTGLMNWNPENMADWGGKLAVDFGSKGLYVYDGALWAGIVGWDTQDMEPWKDKLAADFGSYGLWLYDGKTWAGITGWNPESITAWGDKLAADFGWQGIWLYDGNSWKGLAAWNAENVAAWGDRIVADFGSNGIWLYDGNSWKGLTGWDAENITVWGNKLAADFGSRGIYAYNGTSWTGLTGWDAENITVWGDMLFADFGDNGFYMYNGSSWKVLAQWNPEDFELFSVNALSIEKMMLGDLGKPADYNALIKSFAYSDAEIRQLPAAFNWKSEGKVTPAKHQGSCGSCWAFASVGALESKILINGGPQYDLSEQQLVACSGYDCNGGCSEALRFWSHAGPMEEGCTGYKDYDTPYPGIGTKVNCAELDKCSCLPYNTKGHYTVDTTNPNEIKASLYEDGPTYFSFIVYSDFSDFWNTRSSGKVYTQSASSRVGGHAVLIIGWDDSKQAWLFKNSWGATAGPNGDGTFWIAYSGHANDLSFGMTNFKITGTGPVTTTTTRPTTTTTRLTTTTTRSTTSTTRPTTTTTTSTTTTTKSTTTTTTTRPTTTTTIQNGSLKVTHRSENGYYTADQNLTIITDIVYTGSGLTALGVSIDLPEGWTYDSAGGEDKPPIAKQNGSTLELAWLNPPASPVSFTYTVKVPKGTTGQHSIATAIVYRDFFDENSEPAKPDPLVISPYIPITTTSTTTTTTTTRPTTTTTIQNGSLKVTHRSETGYYTADQNLTIITDIVYTGSGLLALGVIIDLPEGWTYGSAGGEDKPSIAKQNGSTLELAWFNPPASPVSFTYTVKVPKGTTGQHSIATAIVYRDLFNVKSESAKPDPLVISPYIPITTTSTTTTTTTTRPTTTTTIQNGSLSVTHRSETGYYTADQNLTIITDIVYTGSGLGALGGIIDLPDKWEYVSIDGDAPSGVKLSGDGNFEIYWLNPPASPVSFTYTVKVPKGTTGQHSIATAIRYRSFGIDGSESAKPDPLVISPYIPITTTSTTTTTRPTTTTTLPTATWGEHGMIVVQNMTAYIFPDSGYEVENVLVKRKSINGVSVGAVSDYTFSLDQCVGNTCEDSWWPGSCGCTVHATFKKSLITATAGLHGFISVVTNAEGAQVVTAYPDHGYVVNTITVDGVLLEEQVTVYSFSDGVPHTIHFTFKADGYV